MFISIVNKDTYGRTAVLQEYHTYLELIACWLVLVPGEYKNSTLSMNELDSVGFFVLDSLH